MVRTANRGLGAAGDDSPSIEVSRATSANDVLAVANEIASLGHLPSITLSLDKITGLEPNRVSPQWGSVLTNVLMGRLAELSSVTLQLPGSESGRHQVARSGLFFALSRHPGVSLARPYQGLPDVLTQWRQNWRPSDYEQTLFTMPGEDDSEDPDELGTDLVAFLNPNLRPANSSAEDVDSVVYPWLRKLLSRVRLRDSDARSKVLKDVSFATNELLKNVRDHAGIGYDGRCSISLFATGRSQLDSRIYVSVVDDGIGMPASIRARHPDTEYDSELVTNAFAGDLPRRHRGRGEGLALVRDIVDNYGGSLFAATGPSRHGTIVYEHTHAPSPITKCYVEPKLSVKGTVVVLSLATARMSEQTYG